MYLNIGKKEISDDEYDSLPDNEKVSYIHVKEKRIINKESAVYII